MATVFIESKRTNYSDIDSDVFDVEVCLDSFTVILEGIECSWDCSILSRGDFYHPDEYNDEFDADYSSMNIVIQDDYSNELEKDTLMYEKILSEIKGMDQYEDEIMDYIKTQM